MAGCPAQFDESVASVAPQHRPRHAGGEGEAEADALADLTDIADDLETSWGESMDGKDGGDGAADIMGGEGLGLAVSSDGRKGVRGAQGMSPGSGTDSDRDSQLRFQWYALLCSAIQSRRSGGGGGGGGFYTPFVIVGP